MSLKSMIASMQSSGVARINLHEPQTPRPGGVSQGSVLVVINATKDISPAPVYWAIGNVVRKGDALKILGIITHVTNPFGIKSRIDENSWIGTNVGVLQNEIALKKAALEEIPYTMEWCEKAGVNLEIDVKGSVHPKLTVVDEAKAIGAYHVVLDSTMKKDSKYFVEHLTCFVSRTRNSGGVDTIRSFSISKQLPPIIPSSPSTNVKTMTLGNTLHSSSNNLHQLGSATSTTSFELSGGGGGGGDSSESEIYTQGSETFSYPTTGESIDNKVPEVLAENGYKMKLFDLDIATSQKTNFDQSTEAEGVGYKFIDPLRKPAMRKWLNEDTVADIVPYYDHHGSLGPHTEVNEGFRRVGPDVQEFRLAPPPGRQQIAPPSWASRLPSPPTSRMPSPPASSKFFSPSSATTKIVWVWTRSKDVMRRAVEAGWTTFIFTPEMKHVAPEWTSIEWIKPVFLEGGRFLDQDGKQVALLGQVYSGEQLDYLPAMMGQADVVVINDLDWQIIPPEDIVAAFQGRRTKLFATATTAYDAQVYLEALEKGTDGVVLHTDDLSEVLALKAYMCERTVRSSPKVHVEAAAAPLKEVGWPAISEAPIIKRVGSESRIEGVVTRISRSGSRTSSIGREDLTQVGSSPISQGLTADQEWRSGQRLVEARVKRVDSVGMGDRVCVDLCNLLNPGEGLLVGSFAKALFLVHSETSDNSGSKRSFRVNAGPVHAYASVAGGATPYLSELESGSQVLVVDAKGNARTVLVGRVQIESKPLVLIVVEAEGASYSVMLQDADSVRLVIPADMQEEFDTEALPVTQLRVGDTVLLSMQQEAADQEIHHTSGHHQQQTTYALEK
ncbi:unnamed protein product [Sphagnum balticum]